MRKLLLTLIAVLSLGVTIQGRDRDFPRFTFGIEGDFLITFVNAYHYNFIAYEGDRVNVERTEFAFWPNGQISVNAGVNLSRKFNLSLELGYTGAWIKERIVPLSLKLTWFSGRKPLENRWLVYGAIGGAVKPGPIVEQRLLGVAKLGGGYRVSLNRFVKLDFLAGLHGSFIHPSVYSGGQGISGSSLRRNDAYLCALTLGIGLTF